MNSLPSGWSRSRSGPVVTIAGSIPRGKTVSELLHFLDRNYGYGTALGVLTLLARGGFLYAIDYQLFRKASTHFRYVND